MIPVGLDVGPLHTGTGAGTTPSMYENTKRSIGYASAVHDGSWAADGVHCLTARLDATGTEESDFTGTCTGLDTEFDIVYIDDFPVSTLVTIRSVYNSKYMAAEGGANHGAIYVNRDSAGNWEKYMMTIGPDRYFTLTTYHNGYVIEPTSDNSELGHGAQAVSARTNFILRDRGNGTYNIRTKNTSNYWRVKGNTQIGMDGSPSNADAQFEVTELESLGRAADLLVDGDLVIPVAGGTRSIVLPNANVTITEGAWGALESITGTVELPNFSGELGALATMGDMQSGVSVSVSYDTGSVINSTHPDVVFPLSPVEKYFYLVYSQGQSSEWNGIGFSSPDSEQIQLAIDHRTPTVFMYTDMPIFGDTLDAGGFGVSARSNIPFAPIRGDIYTPGTDKTFNTDFWVTGELPVPGLNLQGVGLSVDAEVAMKFKPGALANVSAIPNDGLEILGANGVLTAEINPFGWISIWEAQMGEASLIVNSQDPSNPWVSFSGELGYNDDYFRLPFGLKIKNDVKNSARVEAYIDGDPNNAHPSFVEIEAELGKFGNIAGTEIGLDGRFRGDEDGIDFSGQARFGTRRFSVSGYANGSNTQIEGEFGERISGSVNMGLYKARWSVEFTVESSFTFGNQNDVELEATARACVNSDCDSVSADVELQSNGRVRLCANLPIVGTQCDTF